MDIKLFLTEEDRRLLAGIPRPLLHWYRENARALPWRLDRDPYHVWLSEIMLQQTRVEAVKNYYLRFIGALPDIGALATAPEETVLKLWEGLGYYRRARNLHQAARVIVRDMDGMFPSTYEGILSLPGIGEYTAGAVASICYGLPKPAVDGNVLRLMARILDSDLSINGPVFKKQINHALEEALQDIAQVSGAASARGPDIAIEAIIAGGSSLVGDFNQSLIEAGALLCLPKGTLRCAICPVRDVCRGLRTGRAEDLPVRDKKKARRVERRTVFILYHNPGESPGGDCFGNTARERLALRRRGEEGLLAGMWELPNLEGWLDPGEAIAQTASWGVKPITLEQVLERTHIFTHVEWRMRAFVIRCGAVTAAEGTVNEAKTTYGLVWVDEAALEKAYPLPTAFRLFLPVLRGLGCGCNSL